MVWTIAVGGLALLLIGVTTFAAFGAEWAAVSVVAAIVIRVALVSVPLGALAQVLSGRRPFPYWAAGIVGLLALLTQSLLFHRPGLPLDLVGGTVWLAAAALSAALVDVGAALVRSAKGSRPTSQDSTADIEA